MTAPNGSNERPGGLRYYIDTEFIEDGRTIDLISIGVVCEDGREFYAETWEADLDAASDWVKANVLPHLTGDSTTRSDIAARLVEFVAAGDGRPEFWAYYADYDWVAVCQLFGTMLDLPDGWPMFCMDIKQEAHRLGVNDLPEQQGTEHHALADARWNREAHAHLTRWADGTVPSPPSPVEDGRPDTETAWVLALALREWADNQDEVAESYEQHSPDRADDAAEMRSQAAIARAEADRIDAYPSPGTGDDGSGT